MIEKRIRHGYLNTWTDSLDRALDMALTAKERREPLSIGLLGNAAEVYNEMLKQGIIPDVVTDQTPAHDPLSYVPLGLSVEEAERLKVENPEEFKRRGSVVLEYGNNIRKMAYEAGVQGCIRVPRLRTSIH